MRHLLLGLTLALAAAFLFAPRAKACDGCDDATAIYNAAFNESYDDLTSLDNITALQAAQVADGSCPVGSDCYNNSQYSINQLNTYIAEEQAIMDMEAKYLKFNGCPI